MSKRGRQPKGKPKDGLPADEVIGVGNGGEFSKFLIKASKKPGRPRTATGRTEKERKAKKK
jgi:hypothetical protein